MNKCWFCNKPVTIETLPSAYEHRRKCLNCGNRITDSGGMHIPPDLDPPSYLPMREPLPSRVPDLNPDDMMSAFVAVGNAAMSKRLGPSAEKAEAIITMEHDGSEYVVSSVEVIVELKEHHNAETCRDPACPCFPF